MHDEASRSSAGAARDRHLYALSALLRRDVLTVADWDGALHEVARLACETLGADEGLIAVWDDGAQDWRATTRRGDVLRGREIRLVASRSVLDRVRASGEPILTTAEQPILARSESVDHHAVHSVLAVPVRLWTYRGQPTPRFGACVYVDRRADSAPFTADDVELVRDLAALAERTLSLIDHLRRVEEDLTGARQEVIGTRAVAADAHRDEHYEGADPVFVSTVLEPLRRAGSAGHVGVLLLGPTGCGKSHLAQTFHYASRCREGPFVVLDCGQVTSSEALGAELFGYAKRSGFSAPPEGRFGKARLAHTGTLFIDEIGAMPLDLQQRLLGLLQNGRFSPLGSAEEIAVDIQIVAAANQDLSALIREGRLREDLYWRLAELVVNVPPLDEHPADIPGLARTFLAVAVRRMGRTDITGFTPAALNALRSQAWSRAGNIRGLQHTISRSVLLAPAAVGRLDVGHLSFAQMPGMSAPVDARSGGDAVGPRGLPPPALCAEDRQRLEAKLAEHGGQLARLAADAEVATLLGAAMTPIPLSTLRLRLRQLRLTETAAAFRSPMSLDEIVAAVRQSGDGHEAAEMLGLTRDQLAWRLRQEGLTIRGLQRGSRPDTPAPPDAQR